MKAPRHKDRAKRSDQTATENIPCPSTPHCRPTTDESCFFCRTCFAVLSQPLTPKPYRHGDGRRL